MKKEKKKSELNLKLAEERKLKKKKKIRVEIIKTETRKIIESMKSKVDSLKISAKLNFFLVRRTKKRKERNHK